MQSIKLCRIFIVGLLFSCSSSNLLADHGGSYHSDFDLVVPATSNSGSYDVTWSTTGYYSTLLHEKVGSGPYATIYTATYGMPTNKSFVGKHNGTYTYRIRLTVCYYTCQDFYTAPQSIVVSVVPVGPPPPTNFAVDPGPPVLGGPNMVPHTETYSLEWSESTGALSYEVETKVSSGGTWTSTYAGVATSVPSGTKPKYPGDYYHRVRACDSSATCGQWSNEIQVTVFLWAPPPSPPPSPTELQFATQRFEAFGGDPDANGKIDVLLRGEYANVYLEYFGCPPAGVCLEYKTVFNPASAIESHPSWDPTLYQYIQVDFMGDGIPGILIRGTQLGLPSHQVDFEGLWAAYNVGSLTNPATLQTIYPDDLIVDLGDPNVSILFDDKNGDGIDDLVIFQSGVFAAIYFTDPNTGKIKFGDFDTLDVAADIEAVNTVWNDFSIALRNGDVASYGNFFSTESRSDNIEAIALMGSFAVNYADEWSNLRPVEVTQDFALFVISRVDPNGPRDFPVYFIREPGLGWRIHRF